MAVERSKYRMTYYNKELTEIFESFEIKLFRLLEDADHVIAQMSDEASMVNVPSDLTQKFLQDKLIDMIDQIAERRESQKQKRGRGDKKCMLEGLTSQTVCI